MICPFCEYLVKPFSVSLEKKVIVKKYICKNCDSKWRTEEA